MPRDAIQTEEQLITWKVSESPITIEYSPAVLTEIRAYAKEGLKRLSRGGFESGGILFGARGERLVRVLAWRPIECEHAHGPGFLLSDKDRAQLADALQAPRFDPALAEMHPVGWFVSHTRSGVALTPSDLQIYNDYFPWSWQVALVVQPAGEGPTQAGFFFREPDGSVRAEASYRPFTIEDSPAPPRSSGAEQPRPAPVASRLPDYRYWIWGVPLILAGIVAAMFLHRPPDSNPAPALGLHLTDTGGQLHIQWDRNASAVRNAVHGSLNIKDGAAPIQLPLDARTVKEGSLTYARKSGDLEISMTAYPQKGPAAHEISRFVGSAVAEPPMAAAARRTLQSERDGLARQVERLRARNRELEAAVRALQSRVAGQRKRRR